MAYVYKKFTAQDIAIIPFNAHKQYNFTSASAVTNQVTHFNTSYTSESVSLYSSESAFYGGDTINVIKYNQIDHLFYKNHLKNVSHKKDFIHYRKQVKNFYEKANVLSIPTGLYGEKIKKSSFYLSSSQYEVTDDSFGNLIISGTNLDNYPNTIEENVFRLDPIDGFRKRDLSVYDGYAVETLGNYNSSTGKYQISKQFYRQGSKNSNAPTTYSTAEDYKLIIQEENKDTDDSYFFNPLQYNNVTFETANLGENLSVDVTGSFTSVGFSSITQSYIEVPNNDNFNFTTAQDFSISFYIRPTLIGTAVEQQRHKRYIIAKNGAKRTVASNGTGSLATEINTIPPQGVETANILIETSRQFPFEIYMISQSLYFARSDGRTTTTINGEITSSAGEVESNTHILCQQSSSTMQIYFNGNLLASADNGLSDPTQNKSELFIGSKGPILTDIDSGTRSNTKYFNGRLSNINIWTRAYSATQISNISSSVNGSPYIGNIFYSNGFAAITHPKYLSILSGSTGKGIINTLQFQGTHLMYEHEYQCSIQEHEFNNTTNFSARKTPSKENQFSNFDIANFQTSSHFDPFVTTIGLYNENNELLVVGKLGQPIRKSSKTDTTFIVRYDT